MTSDIFEEWLRVHDATFASADRKVALIVNNCPSHSYPADLKSIKLFFYPPECTPSDKPMHVGIIRDLKCIYRKELVSQISECTENQRPFQLSFVGALSLLTTKWNTLPAEIVSKSFAKAFYKTEAPPTFHEVPEWPKLRMLGLNDKEIVFEQYASCDDSVSAHEGESNGEKHSSKPLPTHKTLMKHIEGIRGFCTAHGFADAVLMNRLTSLEMFSQAKLAVHTEILLPKCDDEDENL